MYRHGNVQNMEDMQQRWIESARFRTKIYSNMSKNMNYVFLLWLQNPTVENDGQHPMIFFNHPLGFGCSITISSPVEVVQRLPSTPYDLTLHRRAIPGQPVTCGLSMLKLMIQSWEITELNKVDTTETSEGPELNGGYLYFYSWKIIELKLRMMGKMVMAKVISELFMAAM